MIKQKGAVRTALCEVQLGSVPSGTGALGGAPRMPLGGPSGRPSGPLIQVEYVWLDMSHA